MDSCRWDEIQRLYHAALERPPGERPGFLEVACGDSELRREVESLLAYEGQGDELLEHSPWLPGETAETLAAGANLGVYRIVRLLGRGGMGEVYLAEDPRLRRQVAIKALRHARTVTEQEKARFLLEARAASALNHANIVTVYDVLAEGGCDFIVMEYVPGGTLAERMARQGLGLKECLEIGARIADALACAHAAGIVHRDLKPSNIMIADNGVVKVLDFGVAKITRGGRRQDAGSTLTLPNTGAGIAVGTSGYMSPEQVCGRPVDHRSDIFSFGLVLYEMLAGRRAFQGDSSFEVMNAILKEEPPELSDSVPPALRSLIADCLAKDPAARFESAHDIACALRALSTGSGASAGSKVEMTPRLGNRGALAVVAATVLVAALAFGVWHWRSENPPIRPRAVAVLYFSNLSEDRSLDWLDRGLTEMLTTNFSEVRGIDVLSTERVASALSQLGKKQVTADIAPVLARRAGAHAFVSGALMRIGPSRLRLDVRVQDTANGQILFSEKIEGEDANAVFKMVDGLTARMAPRFLPVGRTSSTGPSIEETTTSNLEAYRHYQAGRDHQRRFFRRDAIREFQESVRLDPQFALAWMHMGRIYESVGETRKAGEIRERVQPLTARLSRKDRLTWEAISAGAVWDWDGQRRAWEALLAEYPRESYERAHLSHRYQRDDQVQRAIALLKEGLALDPNDDLLWNELSYRQADAGDVASAMESNGRYLNLRPSDPNPWDSRGDILYLNGRNDEAISAYRKVYDLDPQHAFVDDLAHGKLAVVYAANRDYDLAEAALRDFDQSASGNSRVLLPLIKGRLAEERGQMEAAVQHYQRAVVSSLENKSERFLDYSLLALGAVSLLAGNPSAALSFAHGRNIASKDSLTFCLLHANAEDYTGAETCVAEGSPAPRIRESYRIRFEIIRAFARQNADAVLSTAAKAREHEVDSWLLYYRGRALLWKKEYGTAVELFTGAIRDERRHPLVARFRSPVLRLLCDFYLGQAQEAVGKRDEAIAAYREFLSHFGVASTALPQVAEARAALKRLGVA